MLLAIRVRLEDQAACRCKVFGFINQVISCGVTDESHIVDGNVSNLFGYCFFNEENYPSAIKWFDEYLSERKVEFRKEALERKGDCFFIAKDYDAAYASYDLVIKDYFDVNDIYPYYQSAISYGLDKKADKTQVAADIEAAVAAEAAIARKAEKDNADAIAAVDAALKLAVDNNTEGMDSIKELATWINTHGAAAEDMSKAITANENAIKAMDEAYKAADEALDGRLDVIEAALGEGEGSVADQIADAKDAAIGAAKEYTDGEINKLGDLAKKNEADLDLKALAHKDSATGTVAGQTISGVKATGNSAGSINVALEQSEHAMNSTGKFTPAGNVTGTVQTAGSIAVTAKHEDVAATLTKGDYTPAGEVSVALSGNSFNAITGVGTQASFVEGAFTPATLNHEAVSANYVEEALVGSVDENECLIFTAAATKALSASKVNSFNGGSKDADQFTANSLPTMTAQTVGVQSALLYKVKALYFKILYLGMLIR